MTAAELAPPTDPTAPATIPAQTPAADRNARGQFALGNPGGPGRPPKVEYIEREVVAFMAKAISPELWMQIARTAAQQAADGNHHARTWLTKIFLTGRLTEAAAAAEINLPTDIEMFQVGRQKHPKWVEFVDRKRAQSKLEETDEMDAAETAETVASATETAPHRSALTPAASTPLPRTVPVAERVNGFRVTKGPQAPLDGNKRQNAVKTVPAPGPCPG